MLSGHIDTLGISSRLARPIIAPRQLVRCFVLLSMVLFVTRTCVLAQQTNQWFPTDGPNGGPVISLAADSNDNLIAGTHAGIFRLDSGSNRWVRLDSLNTRIFALAAQGETVIASGLYSGLVVSQDAGRTWQGIKSSSADAILFDRDGDAFFARANSIIDFNRSTDRGRTWTRVAGPIGNSNSVSSLALGQGDDILVGTTTAFFRFNKATALWQKSVQVFRELSTIGSKGSYVAAGTKDGLFRSFDNGTTWEVTPLTNVAIKRVAIDSNGTTYAVSVEGVFVSRDSGTSWTSTSLASNEIASIAATKDGRVFAGTAAWNGKGIYRSVDRGASWSLYVSGLTSVGVATVVGDQQELFAGTYSGLHASTDDGRSWQKVSDSIVFRIALHSSGDLWGIIGDTLYHSTDRGSTWGLHTKTPQLYYKMLDIIASPNGSLFLVTRATINRSTDNGNTWSTITPSFGSYTDINNQIHLAIDASGSVFAGNDYYRAPGEVHMKRSTDNGASWTTLASSPSKVRILDVNNRGHIVAVDDGGVNRSSDNGDTWRTVNIGMPTEAYVYGVSADGAGNFYAATDKGIVRLPLGGSLWEKMSQTGLPGGTNNIVFVTPNQTLLVSVGEGGLFRYGGPTSSVDEFYPRPSAASQLRVRVLANGSVESTFTPRSPSNCRVVVVDILGRKIAVLADEHFESGDHRLVWNPIGITSGLYFMVIEGGGARVAKGFAYRNW